MIFPVPSQGITGRKSGVISWNSVYCIQLKDFCFMAAPFLVLWLERVGFSQGFFCSFPLVFPCCKLLSHTNLDIYRASKISGKEEKLRQRRKEKIYPLECRVQRIARSDKKVFLRDQCKEMEENNRMEKTRDLFKKIRDTKWTFHVKLGSIKDRNSMDLT